MYIEMPKPPLRLDDLARKIGAVAEALSDLRGYMIQDTRLQPTAEEENIIAMSHALFDLYSDHIEEYDDLFIRYMKECEIWRRSVQENSDLIPHMGPLVPKSERHRPAAPAQPTGHKPPEWTKTDEELKAQSDSELEGLLAAAVDKGV